MIQNIFVGIMGVIAFGAGVFVWWYDNGRSFKGDKQGKTLKKEKKEKQHEKN